MTEKSLFWYTDGFTGSIGDGAAPYTQEEFRGYNDAWARDGVIASVLNELAVTGSSSPLAVNTGRAIVNGFPYYNDASANVTVTTPSIGDTGKIVVLRADFSAATVRLAITSSADGTATIPSPVQSAGVTWEVELASFVIDTSGNIWTDSGKGTAGVTDTRQSVKAKAGGWHLIESIKLTADTAAPLTFANISPIFDNLRIVGVARSDDSALIDKIALNFNNRTASGDYEFLENTFANTGLSTTATTGTATTILIAIVADTAIASVVSAIIIDIPAYSEITQHKSGFASSTIRSAAGAAGIQRKAYAWWFTHAEAISEIDLDLSVGANFKAGSEFYLYGS